MHVMTVICDHLTDLLSEANNIHCIHCVPEGFTIINLLKAEGLAAYEVVEGGPTPLKPAEEHLDDQRLL